MPRKPPEETIKVTRIYNPDKEAMIKALKIVLASGSDKKGSEHQYDQQRGA